jgi:hypothetical protein
VSPQNDWIAESNDKKTTPIVANAAQKRVEGIN